MSLLRNFSPGGTDPDDEDEQPTTAADPDETAPTDARQPSGSARYAFAAPAAGAADPVPGTVVASEVVPDPQPVAGRHTVVSSEVVPDPQPTAGRHAAAEPEATAETDATAETEAAAEPGHAEDPAPAPVAEPAAPQTAPSPALETPAPQTAPSPTFHPHPVPVPSPRATGDDGAAGPAGMARPAAMAGLDLAGPLLGDAAELRARWQRVQGDFVDDPQAAVSDAADLVGQTAEALMSAVRQRQGELRAAWMRGPVNGTANGSPDGQPAAGTSATAMPAGVPDTEHLRQMMQRYRALFNQLCRPS
jgi:hypothetical protein